MRLPSPRGPLSEDVFQSMRGAARPLPYSGRLPVPASEDFQVTLWVLQEMIFRPFQGVDPRWEDEASAVALRGLLERAQEAELRTNLFCPPTAAQDVPEAIKQMVTGNEGPSLSRWVEEHGRLAHMREFVMHRSPYQRKEADPHSFAIPRLDAGRAKSALLKIQLDEYGNAEAGQSHAELFAETVRALDVRPDIDCVPAVTLRTNTVLNTFGSSRRLRGACIGHLAVFEMTSVEPMARYAATLRRLLDGDTATKAARFYDVHVAADGFHQELALDEMLTGFVEQYPNEAEEVLFGAAAIMSVEGDFSRHLMQRWEKGTSSLRSRAAALAA
ncbi:MAG: iron-containing redox enzyme family protein [Actinobacteria bacterium]|nr:iron-containing redox enzyme family protein [Actinomycetota bacterium]